MVGAGNLFLSPVGMKIYGGENWPGFACIYKKNDKHVERYFEWDDTKAQRNFRKHGIRFEDAVLVFDDSFTVSQQDRIEGGERRWQTFGTVGDCLLLVAHTLGFEDDGIEVIRIIRARGVSRKERRRYEHN